MSASATPRPDRARRAWYSYDWANSVFTNSVTSLFFGPLLTDSVRAAAGPDGFVELLGVDVRAESFSPFVTGFSVILLVVALPLAGIAARSAPRHLLLGGLALTGAAATVAMYSLSPGTYLLGAALYLVAQVCLASSIVVYDTYLPEVSGADDRATVSATGAAAGYLGGAVVLAISLAVVGLHEQIGLSEDEATRLCIAFAGVWWAVFTLYAVRGLPRTRLAGPAGDGGEDAPEARLSLRGLRAALAHLRRDRTLALFLLAFLFFNAAYMTISSQASTFASEELRIDDTGLVVGVLVVNGVAVAGALLAGRLARRFGGVPVLLVMIGVWVVDCLLAFVVPVGSLAWFVVLAGLIGTVHGGTYALARGVFADLVPRGLVGEFFGLFEVVNRSLGAAGAVVFGLVLQVTGDYRIAMASLGIGFAVGGVLLWLSGAGRVPHDPEAVAEDTPRPEEVGRRA